MTKFLVSREDWSLYRQGYLDQKRHLEKIKEIIRNNLPEIISEESIIHTQGDKVIKIPIRSLEEYRIRYSWEKNRFVGQGQGQTKSGEVLGKALGSGGHGKKAGDQPGEDYYETDVTMAELEELIFEDLELPNLEETRKQLLPYQSYKFKDVRTTGLMANVDKKRTLLQCIKRNAMMGAKDMKYRIRPEDVRFKTWAEDLREQTSAVVLAMMDVSGSMGTFEKFIARSFFYWMVRFLRTKYEQVEIVFLAHHTKAKEVTEEEFFTRGESGGTRCSSVYQLALDIIQERYNPKEYNIYPVHFSDGDNLPSDNEKCLELVQKLLPYCNLFGYGEITSPYYRTSSLMSTFSKIQDRKLVTVNIRDKSEVYVALRKFFSITPQEKNA